MSHFTGIFSTCRFIIAFMRANARENLVEKWRIYEMKVTVHTPTEEESKSTQKKHPILQCIFWKDKQTGSRGVGYITAVKDGGNALIKPLTLRA